MRYSSPAVARSILRLGLRLPKTTRLPRQAEPNAQRAAYLKALLDGPWAALRQLIAEAFTPEVLARLARKYEDVQGARSDADDDVDGLFDNIENRFFKLWSRKRMARLAERAGGQVNKFQARQLNKQLLETIGVDVVGGEPELAPVIAAFTKENVSLMRSASQDLLSTTESQLMRALSDGVRPEGLAKIIAERGEVSESRAALIARDQVGKLYGDLNRVRQTGIGVTGYIWRTVKDNRVREEHEQRDGKPFDWKNPPSDGHPGEAINCRCYAEPDLSGLLE